MVEKNKFNKQLGSSFLFIERQSTKKVWGAIRQRERAPLAEVLVAHKHRITRRP
jgi:hypothetical protein